MYGVLPVIFHLVFDGCNLMSDGPNVRCDRNKNEVIPQNIRATEYMHLGV